MNLFEKLTLKYAKSRWESYKRKALIMAAKENKPWYLSKTVLAGIVTMVIGIAGAFGFGAALEGEKDMLIDTVLQITTAVAGIVAVYGRLTAEKELTK